MSIVLIMVILILVTIYNYKNNRSVNVVTQVIEIDDLPSEFEGFTILQLTDLHGKSFGNKQEKLLKLINGLDFDIVAITGDMQNRQDEDYEPFIDLIKGIDSKDIYYTPGNHGPMVYNDEDTFNSFTKSSMSGNNDNKGIVNKTISKNELTNKENIEERELTHAGIEMKNLGVKFLDKCYSIKRENKTLWVSELVYLEEFKDLSKGKYKDNDIKIALTHYPMSKAVYEGDEAKKLGKYDLILAGHYHRGQWRIPYIGGLFIPDLNENGIFPSQDRVSGLTNWGGYKQYISGGIGAGGPVKLLRFRFFNKPEINIIKLVKS
ncbi:MAG: metallophosphoesterase [Clostridium sp.]